MEIMEEWRDIEGYEGLYQVSNLGNVKSLKRIARNNHTVDSKIRKPKIDKDGYCCVSLWIDGVSKEYFIHRLVAQAFVPNPENKPCIDHINTDRTDNTVWLNEDGSVNYDKTNLRWCTHKENTNNPISREKFLHNRYKVEGTHRISIYRPTKESIEKMAEKHKKPVGMYKNGILIKKFNSAADAEREDNNLKFMSISAACNGRLKTYRGYEWRFIV